MDNNEAQVFEKVALLSPDGLQVEYSQPFGKGRRFTITASKWGVSMSESPIFNERSQLDQFARTLAAAYKDFLSLVRTGKPHEDEPPLNADIEMKLPDAEA